MDDSEIYSPRQSIHIGGTTKFLLQKLRNQGDISETDYDNILKAVQVYIKVALKYVLEKFPITDGVLLHAKWITVQKRTDAKWESIEFFIANFKLFSSINIDELYDDYKTLTDEEIGHHGWNEPKIIDWYVDGRELLSVLFLRTMLKSLSSTA